MLLSVNASEMLTALPRIIGYGSLFAYTIWRYRKNRTVVVGVVIVSLSFALASSSLFLDSRNVPDWLVGPTVMLVLLGCLVVLILATIDVVRWYRGRGKNAVLGRGGGH